MPHPLWRMGGPLRLLKHRMAAAAVAAATVVCLVLLGGGGEAFSLSPRHAVTFLLQPGSSSNAAAAAAAAPAAAAARTVPVPPDTLSASAAAAAAAAAPAVVREPLGSSRLLQVRLLALHLEEMVQFYTSLLGMEILGQWDPQRGTRPSRDTSPLLWGPLSGKVALPGGALLPVDKLVLLGYRDEARGGEGGPQRGPAKGSHKGPPKGSPRGLKLELIYSSAWAQQQKAKEETAAAALRNEETALLAAVAAFQAEAQQQHDGSSSSSSSSGLPSLSRMRAYERKRGRYDRGHHGYFGLSFLLPSLQHLQHQEVQNAGGRLLHCPAKRKQVPSMIPDQDVGP